MGMIGIGMIGIGIGMIGSWIIVIELFGIGI